MCLKWTLYSVAMNWKRDLELTLDRSSYFPPSAKWTAMKPLSKWYRFLQHGKSLILMKKLRIWTEHEYESWYSTYWSSACPIDFQPNAPIRETTSCLRWSPKRPLSCVWRGSKESARNGSQSSMFQKAFYSSPISSRKTGRSKGLLTSIFLKPKPERNLFRAPFVGIAAASVSISWVCRFVLSSYMMSRLYCSNFGTRQTTHGFRPLAPRISTTKFLLFSENYAAINLRLSTYASS